MHRRQDAGTGDLRVPDVASYHQYDHSTWSSNLIPPAPASHAPPAPRRQHSIDHRSLKIANPEAYSQVMDVPRTFELIDDDLVLPGGEESGLAKRVNRAFRSRGWREARIDVRTMSDLYLTPLTVDEEPVFRVVGVVTEEASYAVENYRDRIALQAESLGSPSAVECLLRDFNNLYDAEYIVGGVVIGAPSSDAGWLGSRLKTDERWICPILAVTVRQD